MTNYYKNSKLFSLTINQILATIKAINLFLPTFTIYGKIGRNFLLYPVPKDFHDSKFCV